MSDLSQHSEWLSLIEVSGPFLAEPVLKDAFPQGLEGLDGAKKKLVRQAYDEWREAIDLDDPDALKIHKAWIELVLRQGLELDEDGAGDVLNRGSDLADIKCERPEHGVTLTPDFAVVDGQGGPPLMLVTVYEPQVVLSEALKQGTWSASPGERMVELCRATGVRLGLVTNGEQWMFVDAPVGAVTTFASWYGRLWAQEPITLQAFVSLLGIRRFFVDRSEQLPALLDNSLKYQDEVTDALGEQVRRAVEVLIQALDRAHVDSNRTLLEGVEPAELYEAGLTVMMRIVFLLSAEERGLLLLGDELYEANYAVSTLRLQLRAESEEILERRWDAWSRLLSLFRAVYGGIDHEALRLPALGGSLFDPDRFPFLEGRPRGSRWKVDMARPLPIDNRTVLLLLEAVQLFRGRTLSYMALDVEQIGYVYEGLLDRTVVRAAEVTLDLDATKSAKNPWVTLPEIEDAAAQGQDALEKLFKERTESSASRVRNDLNKAVDDDAAEKLLTASHADRGLRDRVKPYFHFLRTDPWGYPLVYPKGTFMVASGSDRRETGTHYTPKSLTEMIVRETLEPLAYVGPAEGELRDKWRLREPKDILDLKVCDPAMGSGAFLVQACRWLAERLVEAWNEAEKRGQSVTSNGELLDQLGSREALSLRFEDRVIIARRLIAERCLYGVDVNPLAVELAKLSIWLITLAKGRPFGFLDHNLRSGDSLLGISSLDQLYFLDLETAKNHSKWLFAHKLEDAVRAALSIRLELRSRPINDIRDVEYMAELEGRAREALRLPTIIADALVGVHFVGKTKRADLTTLSIQAGEAINSNEMARNTLVENASNNLKAELANRTLTRHPFHWPLEFPEVFERKDRGFDCVFGNPPFLGGSRTVEVYGSSYASHLVYTHPGLTKKTDLCCHFFRRALSLSNERGCIGLIGTNSIVQGASRRGSVEVLTATRPIKFALSSFKWPGSAQLEVVVIVFGSKEWSGARVLNDINVVNIDALLTDTVVAAPQKLIENGDLCFIGVHLGGTNGFVIPHETAALWMQSDPKNKQVLFPFIGGDDIGSSDLSSPERWVVSFGERSEEQASQYELPFEHIRDQVMPERLKKDAKKYPRMVNQWWKFWHSRNELYKDASKFENWIVKARVTETHEFRVCPSDWVHTDMVVVFKFNSFEDFSVLQSIFHEVWARRYSSSLGAAPRYIPTDCFETFPRPVERSSFLAQKGKQYHEGRQSWLVKNAVGLTKFSSAYHDPTCFDREIIELREMRRELDLEIARLFGWADLQLEHGFYTQSTGSRVPKPWYGVSSVARAEVFNRLCALNLARQKTLSVGGSSAASKVDDSREVEDELGYNN